MSIHDFFNDFFGGRYGGNSRPPENEDGDIFNPASDKFWSNHGNSMGDFTPLFDFKMSDPFEMHSYFEKRMNDVMKSFFSPEMFPGTEGFGAFGSPGDVPAIKEKQHPRDFYLKPDARKFKNEEGDEKESLSQQPDSSWLERIFSPNPDDPSKSQPRNFSSFRSVVRRSVTLPDGTVKTEEIIRNSDGTEEKTESHVLPDGSTAPTTDIEISIPDFSGWFDHQNWSGLKKNIPRDHFLKPGYEKANPNSLKVDTDLDKQILQSGIESLPSFSKEPELVNPNNGFTFKSFTKRVVTLPNGVVESEEVVRNPDGTEQRTVTKTLPDGTSSIDSEPFVRGSNAESFKKSQSWVDSTQSPLSLTLKGVKDLIDIFFK